MTPAFDVPAPAPPPVSQAAVVRLHAKIGQLIAERYFYCQPPVLSSGLKAMNRQFLDTPLYILGYVYILGYG
jgi:hypothetical protein